MPTGPNNGVIPVSLRTKEQLAAAKGSFTYDDLLRELLRRVPPEAARAGLEARAEAQLALVNRRVGAADQEPESRRSPEKQLLIARIAERRWQRWLREGKVTQLGPRRFRFKVELQEEPARARIVPRPGRGLPPREGASLEG